MGKSLPAEPSGILQRGVTGIRYWMAGPVGAPWVVLTHGATLDHTMFEDQVPALTDRFRVLAWDVPGHGLSQPLAPDVTFRGLVEDLVALLDHLGVTAPVLIGQSMGGNIAQELVFLHPDRARALVLIDCTDNTQHLTRVERFALASAGAIFALYPFRLLKRESASASAEKPAVRKRLLGMMDRVQGKRAWTRIIVVTTDCLHDEPRYHIAVPTLLIRGERDRLGNIAKAMAVLSARDGLPYVVVPGAGHVSNMDDPDFVNKETLRFLTKVTR